MLATLSAAALVVSGLTAASASAETVWLCKPGLANNPCTSSEETTVQLGNGSSFIEHAQPASNPPIDCFYVYPTVSSQANTENGHFVNANLEINPEETQIAIDQASRFSQTCKVYAPIYPQLTLRQINTPGDVTPAAAEKAYLGVLSAWQEYLANYNHGRGIVLIGHSQGALMLKQLIKEQIDPNPALRKQLVSAMLLGGNVLVPKGKTVGGDFQHVPACQVAEQTLCVVAYSSFLKEPPEGAYFGRTNSPLLAEGLTEEEASKLEILCVNPTLHVQGNNAGPLLRYESTTPFPGLLGTYFAAPKAPTPWVSMPEQYSGQCEQANGASWLQLTDVGPGGDSRALIGEPLGPLWGTHLEDINGALGNLVELTAVESRVYLEHVQVTSITPTSGSTLGETAVTIKGSGFLAGATVKIGNAATSVNVVSETEITATTAATAAGSHEVVVTDANGTSTEGPSYTYFSSPAPTVVTGSASAVRSGSANLTATVNPNGGEVSDCRFEYGTTASYGSSAPCMSLPGSGESPVAVSGPVTGLVANTTYHFRISATNANGTSKGSDQTFTTQRAHHYYKNQTFPYLPITEGEQVPTISWGTVTLKSAAGMVTCQTAVLGSVENPVGGGAGRGLTEAYSTADCFAEGCEPATFVEMDLTAEDLPWASELVEREVVGGKVIIGTKTVGPGNSYYHPEPGTNRMLPGSGPGLTPGATRGEDWLAGEEANPAGATGEGVASPIGAELTTHCEFRPHMAEIATGGSGLEAAENARDKLFQPGDWESLNVPGAPVSQCYGEDTPMAINGNGKPGTNPSKVEYDQPGTGLLNCGAFGGGEATGHLVTMGYKAQELINTF